MPVLGFSRPGKGLPEAERSEPLPGREVPSTPLVGVGVADDDPGACLSGEDICLWPWAPCCLFIGGPGLVVLCRRAARRG